MEESNIEKVIAALSYGKRRTLIMRLGENGPIGVKELKKELGLSTGSLYHNLLALGELVEQTPDKKYALSEEGKRVFQALKAGLLPPPSEPELSTFFEALVPVRLFTELPNWILVPTAALILLNLSVSSLYVRIGLALLIPVPEVSFSSTLGSVALSITLVYLAPRLVFKKRSGEKGFLVAVPFCYLPQVAYGWVMLVVQQLPQVLATILPLLTGGLSALIFSAALVCWFKVSPQSALLASFIILYVGAALQPLIS
ncbi:MAG: hypothetical protein ACUVQ0_02170 [Thermoproteota archaeon]